MGWVDVEPGAATFPLGFVGLFGEGGITRVSTILRLVLCPAVRGEKFPLGAWVARNKPCSCRANGKLIPGGRGHRYPLHPGGFGSVGTISISGLRNLLLFYPGGSLGPLPKQRGVRASRGVTVRLGEAMRGLMGTAAAFGSVPRALAFARRSPRELPKQSPLAGNS